MKFKSMRKMVAAALVAAFVMSPASLVHAADVTSGDGSKDVSGNDSQTSTTVVVTPTPTPTPTFEQKMSQTAQASISVAGTEVKTSIAGVYGAMSVSGTAVSTSAENVKTALSLTEEQTPAIIIYDVDPAKSVNAMASIYAGAEATGTEVVACLHIELGARESGKWVTLSDGNVALVAGLPESADTSLTYSVLLIQEGGVITVLEDLDTNPNTVTFSVEAGLGAYAIVAK